MRSPLNISPRPLEVSFSNFKLRAVALRGRDPCMLCRNADDRRERRLGRQRRDCCENRETAETVTVYNQGDARYHGAPCGCVGPVQCLCHGCGLPMATRAGRQGAHGESSYLIAPPIGDTGHMEHSRTQASAGARYFVPSHAEYIVPDRTAAFRPASALNSTERRAPIGNGVGGGGERG